MADGRDAVLVTRPEPGASATAGRLTAMGLTPVVAPLLTVETLAPDLPDPASVRAILITSGNAIGGIPAGWRGLPLLSVGEATARKARCSGFRDVASADADAAALADLAARTFPPAGPPLLLLSGVGQGAALAEALCARGFRVERREAYVAKPIGSLPQNACQALDSGVVRAAMFFSAETARAFVNLVGIRSGQPGLDRVDALAIGKPAAVALSRLPWQTIRVAAKPTQDEMLALLR